MATVRGTNRKDTLRGGFGADTLLGSSDADTLIGNGGNDRLDGGSGADLMRGGSGNDTYIVDNSADRVVEATSQGRDTVRASVSHTLAANVEDILLTGSANRSATGNTSANSLIGNAGANHLDGRGGVDVVRGLAGNDTIVYDPRDSRLDGGSGTDVLLFATATQTLDLSTTTKTYRGFERIDLTGTGDNALVIDPTALLALGATGSTLRVDGSIGDRVGGAGWAYAGEVLLNGQSYAEYTAGTAILRIDSDLDRSDLAIARLNLGQLDGTSGFVLDGVDATDRSGWAVSGAGDVNGDGFADFIIGASSADAAGNARSNAGESYLVFGRPEGFPAHFSLAALDGTNGFVLDGAAAGDYSGRAVAGAGDVNGDGYADLIIGAELGDAEFNGRFNAGESYVVFGKQGGFTTRIDLTTLNGSDGFVLDGSAAGDYSGTAVASAGDVNGDGFGDLLIGADGAGLGQSFSSRGAAFVVFGHDGSFAARFDLGTVNNLNGFAVTGAENGDRIGFAVAAAGDLNADGVADFVVGAPSADSASPNGAFAGETYVVFGRGGALSPHVDVTALDGSNGFTLDGIDMFDGSGVAVSAAGDVNGDGFADLVIGANDASGAGNARELSGESYVIFGKAGGFAARIDLAALNGANGFRLDGASPFDESGRAVAGAGDVNGDGFADLLIGAPRSEGSAGGQSGEIYIVFGHAGSFTARFDLATLDGRNGFVLDGATATDQGGYGVAAAGDVNGDGYDDMLIGRHEFDLNNDQVLSPGTSYVVYGRDFSRAVTSQGGDEDDALSGGDAADVLIGGRGDDTLDGGAGADVLKGGAGDDRVVFDAADFRVEGDSGADTLAVSGAGTTIDLALLGPNRYQGFEIIDLTGSGDNAVVLELRDLLDLPDGLPVLRVDGNAGDVVSAPGQGWVAGGTLDIGLETYQSYTMGSATLLADLDLSRFVS